MNENEYRNYRMRMEKYWGIISSILQLNFLSPNSRTLCINCWSWCNRYQVQRHKQSEKFSGHTLCTPRHFKDTASFKSLCKQNGNCQHSRIIVENRVINITKYKIFVFLGETQILKSQSYVENE